MKEPKHPDKINLGLERVTRIAKQLSLTDFSCPVIIVGGTNGKGSTVACLESIYLAAGYRVGCFTSPYFFSLTEQIRINGVNVTEAVLKSALQVIDEADKEETLTKFELNTLAALWLFKQHPLNVIILEVGLGGRLDAVNVIDATVSIITSIDLDHLDWLGPDRESIGREKAGIFRARQHVVCGELNPPESMKVIAKELEVNWWGLGKNFNFKEEEKRWAWYAEGFSTYDELPKPRLLLQNAAVALMAIALLQPTLHVSLLAIREGLQAVTLIGRQQVFLKPRLTVLDVAHNPAAARLLADYLRAHPIPGNNIAVVGMLADKLILESFAPLLPLISTWYVGGLEVSRGAKAELLIEKLQALKAQRWYNCQTIEQAFDRALAQSKAEDRIVVFGSFHTVKAVLNLGIF